MNNLLLSLLSISSIFIMMSHPGMAQVAVNTDGSAANASAILDIKNTGKGVLIPRMTQAQRDAIASPADGLMIYQTNISPGFYYNAGTAGSPVWQSVGGQNKSVTEIALLQWYQPIATYSIPVGPSFGHRGIAFDGKFMWITMGGSASSAGSVSRFDASGANVGTTPTTKPANEIAFDGTHMWVINNPMASSRSVTKINPSTGTVVTSYPVTDPSAIVFDGTSVWLTNLDNIVKKIHVTTGASEEFNAGNFPNSIAFDGGNIWIANGNAMYVTKVNGRTGAVMNNYDVGGSNHHIVFDGINLWVSVGSNTVVRLNLSGAITGTFAVNNPFAKAFDGTDMWILNQTPSTVTRMNMSGNIIATYPVGTDPFCLAFDGANMWIVNNNNTVTKIHR